MEILPNADKAVIPVEKFTKYALDLESVDGKHKAVVFRDVLGYTVSNASVLVAKIKEGVLNSPATFRGASEFGDSYEIIMDIEGANGRTAKVVTGWMIDKNKDYPRLVTAYVEKKKR